MRVGRLLPALCRNLELSEEFGVPLVEILAEGPEIASPVVVEHAGCAQRVEIVAAGSLALAAGIAELQDDGLAVERTVLGDQERDASPHGNLPVLRAGAIEPHARVK